ncbi:NUDIX hydrolase [Flavobacterium sp. CLA17]|uniref:NUDIX hydrolase n=1 Tax=Flavobacterium sp. CLA17 TaxID=2724135 RepID=UPI001492FAA7|nr:NUDIX hydrolase [Flavobacterium sp. CLA17]QSB26351.1 NUDIX hydrolase [Flavobacterium sp. CLA17]
MKRGDEKIRKIARQYSTNKIEIDCVIFNFENNTLKVLLVKQQDNEGIVSWKLASDYIKKGETILSTAHNILKNYIGGDQFFLEQLKAFSYQSSSSLQEDISIAYYALVKRDDSKDNMLNTDVKWVGINEIAGLNDKHKIILDFSLKELRRNICKSVVGFNLLPEKFTLLQVINLYEEILGIEINKSNFRRKLLQTGIVHDSNEKEEDVSHRAARFYSLNMQQHEVLSQREINFNF